MDERPWWQGFDWREAVLNLLAIAVMVGAVFFFFWMSGLGKGQ